MKNISGKSIFTSLFALFMILSFMMSFSACGKGDKKDSINEVTPEFVYEAKFKELGTVNAEYVSNVCVNEKDIYMLAPYYDENYNLETLTNYFISCPLDGDNMDMGVIKDLKKTESIKSFMFDDDGNMILFTENIKYNKETDEYEGETEYYIINVDNKGKFSNRVKLKPKLGEYESLYFYPSRNIVYINGKLLIASNSTIYTFNKNGSAGKKIELEDYIDYMFASANDKIYIMSNLDGKDGIRELNMETGKLGDSIDCGDHIIYSIISARPLDNGNVYLSTSEGLFECDFKKNKLEFLFNWVNVDIDNNNVVDFFPMKDGSIVVISSEYNYSDSLNSSCNVEAVTITKKKYAEAKQKKRLTFASSYIDNSIKKSIIKFNKMSEDYRIEVIDYSSYEEPQKQMSLDIIAGEIPDIMELINLPKEQYAKKGILTDLYPLMKKDKEVKKEDIIDSVRNTLEIDNKLYYIPMSFKIKAYVGAKSEFGDMEGWTYDEMREKYNNMPKGGMFIKGMTRGWFIKNIMSMQINDFINFKTGEVNLDSKEFIDMLEFSKNFKDIDDYLDEESDIEDEEEQDMVKLVNEGKVLLQELYMYDFSEIQINEKLYKPKGGFTILSAPSKDKNNDISITSTYNCYGISEKCSDKKGAWDFLKKFYTYEYQKNNYLEGFPIRQDVLDKEIEYAMATEKYTDGDGGSIYSIGSLEVEIKPYTKEHMDIFRSIIDRIGIDATSNTILDDISEMIVEETKAFYLGDKTAEETAKILQSRIKIYINEKM